MIQKVAESIIKSGSGKKKGKKAEKKRPLTFSKGTIYAHNSKGEGGSRGWKKNKGGHNRHLRCGLRTSDTSARYVCTSMYIAPTNIYPTFLFLLRRMPTTHTQSLFLFSYSSAVYKSISGRGGGPAYFRLRIKPASLGPHHQNCVMQG